MSHPQNKNERFLIGKRKGLKRVSLWYSLDVYTKEERKEINLKNSKLHRNSTKICSCSMCCNPRKHGILTLQETKFLSSLKLKYRRVE